jgi:hypothetical protein
MRILGETDGGIMDRQIDTEIEVRAPVERAARVLRDAPESVVGKGMAVSGRLLSEVPLDFHGGTSIHQQVEVTLEPLADITDGGFAFELSWFPTRNHLLPAFAGLLEGWESEGTTRLRLSGAYHAPFGPAGVIGDAVLGRRVAVSGVRAFLTELGIRLDAAAAAERVSVRPAEYGIDLRPLEAAEDWLG